MAMGLLAFVSIVTFLVGLVLATANWRTRP